MLLTTQVEETDKKTGIKWRFVSVSSRRSLCQQILFLEMRILLWAIISLWLSSAVALNSRLFRGSRYSSIVRSVSKNGGATKPNYIDVTSQKYFDGMKPDNIWNLATSNFVKQGGTIWDQLAETIKLKRRDASLPPDSLKLRLSNAAVTAEEARREAAGGGIGSDVNEAARLLYQVGCLFLDNFFDERPIQRFWFLETVARIPYFR